MDYITRIDIQGRYPRISEAQLNLISDEAYDRAHAYGQSEVNQAAHDIAYFVNKILGAQ